MKKWVKWLFMFIVLLWFEVGFLWVRTKLVQFKVINEIPGRNLAVSEVLGNIYLYSQGYTSKVKRIEITYTTEVQDIVKLYNSTSGTLVSSMKVEKNGEILRIVAQYNPETITDFLNQPKSLDTDLYAYLCLSLDSANLKRDACYQKAADYIKKVGKFLPVDTVKPLSKLSFRLVKEVQAQSGCSGTVRCGATASNTSCHCSTAPSLSCSYEGDNCRECEGTVCTAWGTCQCTTTYYCNTGLGHMNCSDLTDEWNCENATPAFSCDVGCNTSVEHPCTWCLCGGWTDDACGGGTCSLTTFHQTRSCDPGGCSSQSKCLADPCTAWKNSVCGGGGCVATKMEQTRNCTYNCASESRCVTSATCASCTCGSWTDDVCGGGTCAANQMHQTRTGCTPTGCGATSQCVTNSACNPSCTLSLLPASATVAQDQNIPLTASVTNILHGTVSEVDFSSSNSTIASVAPLSVASPSPFITYATGHLEGQSVTVTANAIMYDSVTCSSTATVTVASPVSWWQVKDSDVSTNGSITSSVPSSNYFGLDGGGGFPGVPAYGGSISLANGGISSTKWNANSISAAKTYDYSYFASRIPQGASVKTITSLNEVLDPETAEFPAYKGYRYFKATSDITTTGNINIGSEKVIILVEGANVEIDHKINVDDGKGFFALFVGKSSLGAGGNISINPSVGGVADGVAELEGIYLADGEVSTGTGGTQTDIQLHIRGSVAGLTGVSLQRDMAVNSDPAELFEYAPDQIIFLLNSGLGVRKMSWKEVAP